jgi:hypothetical protein
MEEAVNGEENLESGLSFKEKVVVESQLGTGEMLKVLIASKEENKSIGISSPRIGEGFFITAVEDIILVEGETIILFKPFDVTGFILPTNKLRLVDINAVCPLSSEFQNPVLKNFDKNKTWYF